MKNYKLPAKAKIGSMQIKHLPSHLPLFLTFIACITAGAMAADSSTKTVDLRPHWHAGQQSTYKVNSILHQTQTVNMDGHSKKQTTIIALASKVVWKVDKANSDGSYECTLSRKWMSATITGPKGEKKVSDTRSGQDDIKPLYQVLKALTDNPLQVHIDADGTANGVTGLDNIKAQVKIKKFVPKKADVQRFVNTLAAVAAAPASANVEDNWQYNYTTPNRFGTISNQMQYTLKSVDKISGIKTATITGQGQISFNFDRSKLPKGAPPMDVSLQNSSYKSQIIYDFSRHEAVGRNISSSQTMNIDINLTADHTLHETLQRSGTRTILRIGIGKDNQGS